MDRGEGCNQHQQAAPRKWAIGTKVAPCSNAPVNRPSDVWSPVVFVTAPSAGPPPGHCPSNGNHPVHTNLPGALSNRPGNPSVDLSSFPYGRSKPEGNPYAHGGVQSCGNPYVNVYSVHSKSSTDRILTALDRCGRKLEDNTRKAAIIAGNVWNHLKTGTSITDTALSRLSQETKVLAEGGNDKVFQQTFGLFPGEQLQKAYACYLSTLAGPVIGKLYVSTARIAFCSDQPLCYDPSNAPWGYYTVVVRLDQLKEVNPSAITRNPSEKCIQIITIDNHEFWFLGFVSYDKALKHLKEAQQFTPHCSHQCSY
ncbi:GEM-like protein 1 [Canna indica]|uniref:GEM-like protein 1 n=1 Tax=Canna indica TaxID=4628 RepID=A0AAQ3QAV5_9LILI|nr:GEM-like protein 1 [Canna indica]